MTFTDNRWKSDWQNYFWYESVYKVMLHYWMLLSIHSYGMFIKMAKSMCAQAQSNSGLDIYDCDIRHKNAYQLDVTMCKNVYAEPKH